MAVAAPCCSGPSATSHFAALQRELGVADVYHMTEQQAEAVVRLQLGQLAALERDEIFKEYSGCASRSSSYERCFRDESQHPRGHSQGPGGPARQVRRRPQDRDHRMKAAMSTWKT